MIIYDKFNKKYLIREVQVSDANALIDYMSTVHVETQNLIREPEEWSMTVEQEEKILEHIMADENSFMAVIYDGEKLIASAGFQGKKFQRVKHRVTLGISILKEYHNLGLGYQFMIFMLDHAKHMGKKTVDLSVRSDNKNAIHLYRKVGFVDEGIRKEGFFVNGTYIDELLMAKHL